MLAGLGFTVKVLKLQTSKLVRQQAEQGSGGRSKATEVEI